MLLGANCATKPLFSVLRFTGLITLGSITTIPMTLTLSQIHMDTMAVPTALTASTISTANMEVVTATNQRITHTLVMYSFFK